jgi:phosphate transport system substrate-binding protein
MRKHLTRVTLLVGVVALAATAWAATGAARPFSGSVSGTLTADGSSTVAPFATAAAEAFQRSNSGARVTVGVSGTGGGFERFCKGEIDMANASRPIRYSEAKRCQDAGIRYIQFLVANDGISLVVNRSNTWANCLTVDELKKVWDRGSKVNNWQDVRAGFPDVPLKLYGPGTDSGTFEFFTEKVNGRARQSRSDYNASEDDNVLVRGVQGDRGGMAYFGLSYYLENKSRLKVLRIDSGNGCQTPSIATVQNRAYKPLSRALFIYVKRTSFNKAITRAFIKYVIVNEKKIATTAKIVPLTKAQILKAKRQYNTALKNRA